MSDQEQKARWLPLVLVHSAMAVPLTGMAVLLCALTLNQIKTIKHGYPWSLTLGMYNPLGLGIAFHQIGVAGLLGLLVAMIAAVALLGKSGRTRLATTGMVLHVLFLGLASLAYGLSAYQLSLFVNWGLAP